MARELSVTASTQLAAQYGTEPVLLLKIEWESGTDYYGSKQITIDGDTFKSRIQNVTQLQAQVKEHIYSDMQSISIELIDTLETLKAIYDADVLEGVRCTLYQYLGGDTLDDAIELFAGRIVSPIVWGEGTRTLSFEVETTNEEGEVGFAPEEGSISYLNPDAIDQPWPLCFGAAIRVPAVKARKQFKGSLRTSINQRDNTIDVIGGEEFPQGVNLQLRIGKILYSGSFSGETFTVATRNDAYHSSIVLADRPTDDIHFTDARVLWLDGDEYIGGLYCYIDHAVHGPMVNHCTYQIGKKCWFAKPWRPASTTLEITMDSNTEIEESAAIPRATWGLDFAFETISYQVSIFGEARNPEVIGDGARVIAGMWGMKAGVDVQLRSTFSELYVANLVPSVEIKEILGKRTINGKPTLVPIPSNYYTANLSHSFGGQNITSITFSSPLAEKDDGTWEDSVYVTLRSSLGTNGADIIQYLLETYSENITVDSTTFSAAKTLLVGYPCNFALMDRGNVLSVCEDIAWQLRCGLAIRNNVAYLYYLSQDQSSILTIDEDTVLSRSANLSFTDTESIYTRLVLNYNDDYSIDPKSVTYRNNIDTYGLRTMERDCYIYQHRELVEQTANFWGWRYSNIWRQLQLITTIDNLQAETFDTVAIDIAALSGNTLQATVLNSAFNPIEHTVSYQLELASKAGDYDTNGIIDDPEDGYNGGDPNDPVTPPTIDDPLDGKTITPPYIPPGSGGTGSGGGGGTEWPPVEPPEPPVSGESGAVNTEPGILYFTTDAYTLEWGDTFDMEVTLKTSDGERIYENMTVSLVFATDASGISFNKTSITLVSGRGTVTGCSVTGGSTAISCTITAMAGTHQSDVATVNMIATKTDSLSWDTVPTSVDRDELFSVAISGGSDGDIVGVVFNRSDSGDKLYFSDGRRVNQITLDASGEYSNQWYISGGTGSDYGSFNLTSDDYSDELSAAFPVTGLSVYEWKDYLGVSDNYSVAYLDLEVTGTISPSTPFTLTITAYDKNGNVDTSFNGTIIVNLTDPANGDENIEWVSAGGASIVDNIAFLTMTNGVWTSSNCIINVSEFTSQCKFSASGPYPEAYMSGTLTETVNYGYILQFNDWSVHSYGTGKPDVIRNVTKMDILVQIVDTDGVVQTDLSGTVNLSVLVGADGDAIRDGYDTISISSGEGTKTIYIDGTASETFIGAKLAVSQSGFVSGKSPYFNIVGGIAGITDSTSVTQTASNGYHNIMACDGTYIFMSHGSGGFYLDKYYASNLAYIGGVRYAYLTAPDHTPSQSAATYSSYLGYATSMLMEDGLVYVVGPRWYGGVDIQDGDGVPTISTDGVTTLKFSASGWTQWNGYLGANMLNTIGPAAGYNNHTGDVTTKPIGAHSAAFDGDFIYAVGYDVMYGVGDVVVKISKSSHKPIAHAVLSGYDGGSYGGHKIAVGDTYIAVVDISNDRLHVIDKSTMTQLTYYGYETSQYQMDTPQAVAVYDKYAYVTSTRVVTKIDMTTGEHVRTTNYNLYASYMGSTYVRYFDDIVLHTDSTLYVVTKNNVILQFDLDLNLMGIDSSLSHTGTLDANIYVDDNMIITNQERTSKGTSVTLHKWTRTGIPW